jgi:hypothetical protein
MTSAAPASVPSAGSSPKTVICQIIAKQIWM